MKALILLIMIVGIASIACAEEVGFDALISDYLVENYDGVYSVHGVHEKRRVWIPEQEVEYIYVEMFLHRGTTILECLGCICHEGEDYSVGGVYQIGEEEIY